MLLKLLITLVLVALNGFFVAAEFAIVKLRASQVEPHARTGDRRAIIAKNIAIHLDRYLSACQLGITLASLALGWIGEPVVVAMLIQAINSLGFQPDAEIIHYVAAPIAFALITTFHIVLGEQAPKYIGIERSLSTSLFVAYPLQLFYYIFKPFIWLLNSLSNAAARMFGVSAGDGHETVHSPQELLYILEESKEGGTIGVSEHQMLENVFDFYDRPVRLIMVPRTQIVSIQLNQSASAAIDLILKEGYSRLPVYGDSIDNILGLVYEKDLLQAEHTGRAVTLQELIRPAYFIPETKKLGNLLRDIQQKKIHMAIILDEFGGTSGLVTLEDIIEELVGEIQDEYDTEAPWVEKKSENEFLVNASTNIIDVNECIPVTIPESPEYDTVSGYVNMLFGRIPEKGEQIQAGHYNITVLEKARNRVKTIKMELLPPEPSV